MNVSCPDCNSGNVEEVDVPLNGNVEYECCVCGFHWWSDEVAEREEPVQ